MITDEKTLPVNQRKLPPKSSAVNSAVRDASHPVSQQSSDVEAALNKAYEELGRAFYNYRFEEPTPELIEYFDQITCLRAMRAENSSHASASIHPQNRPVQAVNPISSGIGMQGMAPGYHPGVQPMAQCPYCHQPIAPDSAFCGSCGRRIR